jgi:Trp operon repressor
VLLANDFRQKLFTLAIETIGSQKELAKELGVSETMVMKWRKGTNKCGNRACLQCMPLWALKMILQLVPPEYRLTVQKIEGNVTRYQAKGGAPVLNPRLPLMEDERLVRIFFHLAGDGYGGRFGGARPFYYNTDPAVMEEFVNDLKVFGDVYTRFEEGKFRVFFSKAVAHVIKHIYKTNFMSHEVRIPQEFFGLGAQVIAQGIKALADDEGTMLPYRVKICSSNKPLLEDVQKLLIKKFPEFSGHVVINRGGKAYNLVIRSGGIELFAKRIGFTHTQKSADLKLLLRMKNKVRKSTLGGANTRARILKELANGKGTARELMRALEASSEMIRNLILGYESNGGRVLGLQELGLVEGEKNSKGYLWKKLSREKVGGFS